MSARLMNSPAFSLKPHRTWKILAMLGLTVLLLSPATSSAQKKPKDEKKPPPPPPPAIIKPRPPKPVPQPVVTPKPPAHPNPHPAPNPGTSSGPAQPVHGTVLPGAILTKPNGKTAPSKPPTGPQKPPGAGLTMAESRKLREAYALLREANYVYRGHKMKAMEHLVHGINHLDDDVLKNGTPEQKAALNKDKLVIDWVNVKEDATPPVHELQVLSDARMRQAGILLQEVRPVLAASKKMRVLARVDGAMEEITAAMAGK